MPDNTPKAEAKKAPAKTVAPPVVDSLDPNEIIDWIEPTLAEAREMDLSRSLANARAEFKPILRNKTGNTGNRDYTYADHADVLDAVIVTLAKYEVEVAHEIVYKPGDWMFIKVMLLKGSDIRALEWPIGRIESKNQTNGANLTYAKRYAISTILNLAPDDDTDGQADSGSDDRGGRRDSRGRDRDDHRSRSNFDDRGDDEDPNRWREDTAKHNGDEGRGRRSESQDDGRVADKDAVRSGKVRTSPKKEDVDGRHIAVAIDSLNSSGNRRSAEMFWDVFVKATGLVKDDPRYQSDERFWNVRDLYAKRWRMHKDEDDAAKDPLGAKEKAAEKPADKPKPEIEAGEDHMSPDIALGEIETLLENATSMVEYDRILKEHAHLFKIASMFPPDEDLLRDMKELAVERIEKLDRDQTVTDERFDRVEDVEDRDRSENGRPDLSNERF